MRLTLPIRVLIAIACAALGLLPFSMMFRFSLSWETNNHVTNLITNDARNDPRRDGRLASAAGRSAATTRPAPTPPPAAAPAAAETATARSAVGADPCTHAGVVLDDFCDEGSIVRPRMAP